ncbi:MAG: TonB-dependent receptor [Saprospiraceae bacterium]|nr:TonB-dependent receptor [Saprospiraceae bacterium]
MIKFLFIPVLFGFSLCLLGQGYTVGGSIKNKKDEPVSFATLLLKKSIDSSLVKVAVGQDDGSFSFLSISPGTYFIHVKYIGFTDFFSNSIELINNNADVGTLVLSENSTQLAEVSVVALRPIVEVKADKTVFNVQGTINAVGDNGLNLLRKAPGVMVDNNNNISVLGRSGVLVYIDGRRIPMSGQELSNYLENLNAEQIDRIDIITNPGSKYEAQGNAGIIDIRLKKDSNVGGSGSISSTVSQGRYATGNLSGNGNYRNKKINIFGNAALNKGTRFNDLFFQSYQNQIFLEESHLSNSSFNGVNGRLGLDYYLNKKSTFGILISGLYNVSDHGSINKTLIAKQIDINNIDSILIANNSSDANRGHTAANLNYSWTDKTKSFNMDLDYGLFRNQSDYIQPNNYYTADLISILTSNLTEYQTRADIDIFSFKADYEQDLLGGKLGAGTKWTKVETANQFLFYNVFDAIPVRNDRRSNLFDYSESVYAGYLNYKKKLGERWNISAGLRTEYTDASGDLSAFIPELEEPAVLFNYLSLFPSGGISYSPAKKHSYSLQYGRRINRPDYNVLNPFKEQLSELSYSSGNKFLKPEIVNNIELGYTYNFKYSVKLAYSLTTDQITRLMSPDPIDPRANYISWDNLATQEIYGLNVSLPMDFTKWWNAYFTFNFNLTNNQANYGGNAQVDVQAYNFNLFHQQTFQLGKKWKAEVSGWYSGPGVWGGIFLFDPCYSLNLGIQRKFLSERLNARLTVNDIFYQAWWSGYSSFNGLHTTGYGKWDSRRVALSLNYDLGNKNIKSRKRSTGIESESKRVGE